MNNELKLMAVMAYPNAQVRHNYEYLPPTEHYPVAYMKNVSLVGCRAIWDENIQVNYRIEDITIILRSPSSLTDEECIEVAKIARLPVDLHTAEFGRSHILEMKNDFDDYLHLFDYLRSINIVTEFMGVNLIEAGWAIIQA